MFICGGVFVLNLIRLNLSFFKCLDNVIDGCWLFGLFEYFKLFMIILLCKNVLVVIIMVFVVYFVLVCVIIFLYIFFLMIKCFIIFWNNVKFGVFLIVFFNLCW